jgi:hypothetical protein
MAEVLLWRLRKLKLFKLLLLHLLLLHLLLEAHRFFRT